MNLLPTFAVAVLLVSSPALANLVPMIVENDGQSSVKLPKPLQDLIKIEYPKMRVPARKDMIDNWALRTEGPAPYICWGDFNGDNLTDVALFLLSDSNYWMFVIYHQLKGNKYKRGHEVKMGMEHHNVHNRYLKLRHKEDPLTYSITDEAYGYKRDRTDKYIFTNDTIELGIFEFTRHIIYWAKDQYKSMMFGE